MSSSENTLDSTATPRTICVEESWVDSFLSSYYFEDATLEDKKEELLSAVPDVFTSYDALKDQVYAALGQTTTTAFTSFDSAIDQLFDSYRGNRPSSPRFFDEISFLSSCLKEIYEATSARLGGATGNDFLRALVEESKKPTSFQTPPTSSSDSQAGSLPAPSTEDKSCFNYLDLNGAFTSIPNGVKVYVQGFANTEFMVERSYFAQTDRYGSFVIYFDLKLNDKLSTIPQASITGLVPPKVNTPALPNGGE